MTKKDYILIAEVLNNTKPVNTDPSQLEFCARERQWSVIVDTMADMLADNNPRFDRARFIKATQ
jgi:hypothetical protein